MLKKIRIPGLFGGVAICAMGMLVQFIKPNDNDKCVN